MKDNLPWFGHQTYVHVFKLMIRVEVYLLEKPVS